MTKLCSTPACINELTPNSRLDTCANCRAAVGHWKRRRPAERLERRRKLRMYDSRMSTLVEDKELDKHIKGKRDV